MDRLKSISKSGWRPNSSTESSYAGASESRPSSSSGGVTSRLTRNFKGLDQVAGWVGKGGPTSDDGLANVRPVSALRDPASFGPPPKRVPNAGGSNHRESSQVNDEGKGHEDRRQPKSYFVNTAGLSTEALPLSPEPTRTAGFSDEAGITAKRPPLVPPRLPLRDESTLPKPRDVTDMRTGDMNMTAVGRLSKAGILVPGFSMAPDSPSTTKPPLPIDPKSSASMNSLGSPKGTPAEGTTFTEKRAALTTANSFYKNPSSVSFSDASAALKTGRNFQQRHGDQVSSGYKKAQEMGLDKKVQGYSDLYASRDETGGGGVTTLLRNSTPLPPPVSPANKPGLPPRPTNVPNLSKITPDLSGPRNKRPPPPPPPKKKTAPPLPKKQAPTAPPHNSPTRSPPIIPRATRPSPSAPLVLQNNGFPTQNVPETPPDLDLSLENAWFSKNPLKLPPSIQNIEEKMYLFTNSWERSPSGRTKHTVILAIRWTLNLSTTKIKITWDASAPSATAKAEQRHFPPPSSPPPSKEWGDRIVDWVRARISQQVGNGECWTLAADCLSSLQSEDEVAGVGKVMAAQGTSFGLCIFSHYPSLQYQPTVLPGSVLQPGDILQFRSARWTRRDTSGRVVFEMRAGAPEGTEGCKDHTAVVETVQYDPHGGIKLGVLQQNSNGVRVVDRGEYTLGTDDMVEGGVRVFRAVADGWAKLDADW